MVEISTSILSMKEGEETKNYNKVLTKGAKILGIFKTIAVIVAIITITIIGIRYMIGSVEQKAQYKETMIPVIIGCVLVIGLAGILTAIQAIFSSTGGGSGGGGSVRNTR